jgi:proteic killer suppression protein
MIRSFTDRDTEKILRRLPVRKMKAGSQRIALRKLRQIDAAVSLEDLRVPPGIKMEKQTGERAGQHSIRIDDEWRVCFRWIGSDACDVEVVRSR